MSDTIVPVAKQGHPDTTIREQSKKVVEDVKELGEITAQTATATAHDLAERGSEALQEGREKMARAKQSVDEYIAEKPLQSVLMALGAGFLLGAISRR